MFIRNTLGTIIYEALVDEAKMLTVTEVRIGLGYAGIALSDSRLGLAAVLKEDLRGGCSVLDQAGSLAGSEAHQLLALLVKGRTPIEKALGYSQGY